MNSSIRCGQIEDMSDTPDLFGRIAAAAIAIRSRSSIKPRFGLTLGTGLGGLAEQIEVESRIDYAEIPWFPEPRVTSHSGSLLLGHLGGKPIAALEGRYHLYEGYNLEELTLPVRVLKALGVEVAIFSNAAGGLNPQFDIGDLVVITDHINLMFANPLVGPNDERLGPRFPDMSAPYSVSLNARMEAVAQRQGLPLRRGVYAAMTGPCLETRAEYRMLKLIGADLIGMSTVPEVIVGVHAGLTNVGISCVTDLCLPDALEPVKVEEIIRVAGEAEPKMTALVKGFIESFDDGTVKTP